MSLESAFIEVDDFQSENKVRQMQACRLLLSAAQLCLSYISCN